MLGFLAVAPSRRIFIAIGEYYCHVLLHDRCDVLVHAVNAMLAVKDLPEIAKLLITSGADPDVKARLTSSHSIVVVVAAAVVVVVVSSSWSWSWSSSS